MDGTRVSCPVCAGVGRVSMGAPSWLRINTLEAVKKNSCAYCHVIMLLSQIPLNEAGVRVRQKGPNALLVQGATQLESFLVDSYRGERSSTRVGGESKPARTHTIAIIIDYFDIRAEIILL
jgi:hypothetical protein